jgi:protein-tyrosine phosphatase
MAEGLLKQCLPDFKIESAGLCACNGYRAEPLAARVAENHGLSLEHHIARQLDSELIRGVDLILVMEDSHLKTINSLMPEARGKTMLLSHWNERKQMPDPYGKDITEFERVFFLIQESVKGWKILQGCINKNE